MENNTTIKQVRAPKFNSGLAYLEAIRSLLNRYHEAFCSRQYELAWLILNQAQQELLPRLERDEQKEVIKLGEKCWAAITVNVNAKMAYNNILAFNEWFGKLYEYAHRAGLIMPDKASFFDDKEDY